MFDIHTVGAGGGSVAYVDAGGALRVGPRSAGALPGPACYHKGGTLPTVTDADVVLGRLPGDTKLGGDLPLAPALAEKVIARLAGQLGMSIQDAAAGVARVVEANIARAVRDVTAARGVDPRGLTLVSFGGAGGLHALPVAAAAGMRRVLVPPLCGVLSAFGMLVAPPQGDASRTVLHLARSGELDDDRLYAEFGRLSAETMDAVPAEATARTEASADVRYAGQTHTLTVGLDRPSLARLRERFEAHVRRAVRRGRRRGDRGRRPCGSAGSGAAGEIDVPELTEAPERGTAGGATGRGCATTARPTAR